MVRVYAMNEAIFQNKVFGRDIIFTYGPLTSVFTHMYHPGTDTSILGFAIFLVTALFASCLFLSRGNYLILPLPLILSLAGGDTFFICLPLIFLLVITQWVAREIETSAFTSGVIAFIGTAVALLPLVKASFSVPVITCGVLYQILMERTYSPHHPHLSPIMGRAGVGVNAAPLSS
jgi:hypothetical protein